MSRTNNIIGRFPDFYQSHETENLLYKYIEGFAHILNVAEEDLLGIMRTHWVNKADNAGSKGFDAAQKGDLDKIFALYLEALGGTSLLKQGNRRTDTEGGKADDDLYRKRILSIINTLKNGAATRQGIIDIISANLGMADDLPFAKELKQTIRIEEFLPTIEGDLTTQSVRLFEKFEVENKGLVPAIPEFRLSNITLPALYNIRFVNLDTKEFIQFTGIKGLTNGIGVVKKGEDIYFLSNGTGLHRGQSFRTFGKMTLPPGKSNIRVEAGVGIPAGIFDETRFDAALFDINDIIEIGRFDETNFDNAIFSEDEIIGQLEFRYKRLRPGAFKAIVPWDIAGFSVEMTLTDEGIARLKVLGLAQNYIDVLKNWTGKNKKFDTIEAFYAALPVFTPTNAEKTEIKNILNRREKLIQKDFIAEQALKDLIRNECIFSDKYARFEINPRAQIKTIVDRVKAAGIYSLVAFEKRFWEHQELGDTLAMNWQRKAEIHELGDTDVQLKSVQSEILEQNMDEQFNASGSGLSGVFDYTYFDSLNGFA